MGNLKKNLKEKQQKNQKKRIIKIIKRLIRKNHLRIKKIKIIKYNQKSINLQKSNFQFHNMFLLQIIFSSKKIKVIIK
jgi:hypothetical protein